MLKVFLKFVLFCVVLVCCFYGFLFVCFFSVVFLMPYSFITVYCLERVTKKVTGVNPTVGTQPHFKAPVDVCIKIPLKHSD